MKHCLLNELNGLFSFISIAMFEMFDEKGYDEQQSLFLSELQTGHRSVMFEY